MPDRESSAFWPGYVSRQALNEFAQSKMPELNASNNELMDNLEFAEKAQLKEVAHSLNEAIMQNFGYQKALRDITEWATYLQPRKLELASDETEYDAGGSENPDEQVVDRPAVAGISGDSDERAVDVSSLKERFNG